MGSKSKSKSSTSNTTTTTTENQNVQLGQGDSVIADGDVSITDGGAIQGSLDIGRDAVAAVTQISAAFLDANKQTNDRALGLSESVAAGAANIANNASTDDTAETIQTLVKWGAGAAVAVAGAYIFARSN